ncbi:Myb-like DNA-binding domain containing protein [Histomonas meleagridis]|uniref:Myb-like DNA-binding domain containing protein n=1 Tax=Histomonas meleagridis TaxID=135588 RepID=UPI0035599A29|nr:Myb-like DNA-binding domain containing protein [Histomonas meleagridis]KAH0804244.1 Myb-like DNA-binding domain containing protein [Histomonas meleagridis]
MMNDLDQNSIQQQQQQAPIQGVQQQIDGYPQICSNTSIQPQDLINFLMRIQQSPKDNSMITRGTWNQQEDEMLTTAVNQLGPKKWTDIAKFVPTRTPKQCRERWFQRLQPGIRHDPFEPWEDQVIIQSQKELGNRWSLIAQKLQGRSPSSIKNRWYSGLRNQTQARAQLEMGLNQIDPNLLLAHENGNNQDSVHNNNNL